MSTPSRTRRSVVVALLLLATAVGYVATASGSGAADDPGALLQVSLSPDRSSPVALDGLRLDEGTDVFVFVPTRSTTQSVTFHVDDPDRTGPAWSTDPVVPSDLRGTTLLGDARPLDPAALGAGWHTITASVRTGLLSSPTVAHARVFVSGPGDEVSLFDTLRPTTETVSDAAAVELGTRFRSAVDGEVLGVRFWAGPRNAGPHVGSLWTADGDRLASVEITADGTGWQEARFSAPVPVEAGVDHVVSYHAPNGFYSGDNGFFAGRSVTDGPLTAPADGDGGPNGVYRYGASAFPDQTFGSTQYYVDVVFAQGRSIPAPGPDGDGDGGASLLLAASLDAELLGATVEADVEASVGRGGSSSTTAPSTTTTTSPDDPPPPPNGSWPGPDTTGVPEGVALTPTYESITVTEPGTVIEGLHLIDACISVRADDVVIRNVRITAAPLCGSNLINVGFDQTGVLIEDVELDGLDSTGFAAAIGDQGYTCRRCDIHSIGVGAVLNFGTIEDSWIHDLFEDFDESKGGLSHNETIISNGDPGERDGAPARASVIRRNNLSNPHGQTSAISLFGDFGPIRDVLVEQNLLNGGGYVVYGGSTPGKPFADQAADVRVLGNHFGTDFFERGGAFGPVSDFDSAAPGNVWSGNVWADTGDPVNP